MSGVFFQFAAISAVAGVVSVLIVLVLHIVKYGEEKGAMSERVKRLEQEMIEQKEVRDTVADLKTTVTLLHTTVTDFKDLMMKMMGK